MLKTLKFISDCSGRNRHHFLKIEEAIEVLDIKNKMMSLSDVRIIECLDVLLSRYSTLNQIEPGEKYVYDREVRLLEYIQNPILTRGVRSQLS